MEIAYRRRGDNLSPRITLSDPSDASPLDNYLRENKPALYAKLLLTERLYPLCREADMAAAHRLATIPDRETAHETILSESVCCQANCLHL
jgi:hypothetical protein